MRKGSRRLFQAQPGGTGAGPIERARRVDPFPPLACAERPPATLEKTSTAFRPASHDPGSLDFPRHSPASLPGREPVRANRPAALNPKRAIFNSARRRLSRTPALPEVSAVMFFPAHSSRAPAGMPFFIGRTDRRERRTGPPGRGVPPPRRCPPPPGRGQSSTGCSTAPPPASAPSQGAPATGGRRR